MPKNQILIAVAVVGLSFGVYLLPKSVVRDEEGGTGMQKQAGAQTEAENTAPSGKPAHQPTALPPKSEEQLARWRRERADAAKETKWLALSDSIIELFRRHNRFDSVAHYSAQVAQRQGADSVWVAAGDAYTEAMQFAVSEKKAKIAAENARKAYRKVSANYPDSLSLQAKTAFTRIVEGAPMKAIFGIRDVLEKDPDNRTALYLLGLLSIRSGQYEKAVGRFERLTELESQNAEYWLYLGISRSETGAKAGARQALRRGKAKAEKPEVKKRIKEAMESIGK